MTPGSPEWMEWAASTYGDLMAMEGYDDCIVGVVEDLSQNAHVVYDEVLVIQKNEKDHGMSRQDAIDYFYHNQRNAFIGINSPLFLSNP